MAVLLKDRVGAAITAGGVGAVTLGAGLPFGTVPNRAGWRTFAEAGVTGGNTIRYLILDANGAWEYGPGVYGADASPFPNASSTGPAPGTVFTTSSGELATTANGQVIQGRNHAGYILIKHSNVTIQDCIINTPDDDTGVFAIGWDGTTAGITGLKVLRCRVIAGFAMAGVHLDALASSEVGFCDISRCENGIMIAANTVNIHDNYIHGLLRAPDHADPHFDCIQGFPGPFTGWTINHNTLETRDTSGMITGQAGQPTNSGLTFSNNLVVPVEPVSYGIQVLNTTTVTLTNNRFRRPTLGGTVYPLFPMDMVGVTGLTHSGNVDDVTGAPLTPSIS